MANKPWDAEREALRAILRGLRERGGVTQSELSSALGKPQSYVSKYESGERKLDFVEVLEICRILKISPIELVGLYVEKCPSPHK